MRRDFNYLCFPFIASYLINQVFGIPPVFLEYLQVFGIPPKRDDVQIIGTGVKQSV